MQHSRISCRRMFGTIQRHSDRSPNISEDHNRWSLHKSYSITVFSAGNKMTTMKEAGLATIEMKLEVIVIPVSDAARAEQFYRKLAWRQDVTPPGSGVFHPARFRVFGRRLVRNKLKL